MCPAALDHLVVLVGVNHLCVSVDLMRMYVCVWLTLLVALLILAQVHVHELPPLELPLSH